MARRKRERGSIEMHGLFLGLATYGLFMLGLVLISFTVGKGAAN